MSQPCTEPLNPDIPRGPHDIPFTPDHCQFPVLPAAGHCITFTTIHRPESTPIIKNRLLQLYGFYIDRPTQQRFADGPLPVYSSL